MEAQEIFLKENLKFLRNRKKLSQQALAEELGMTRAKYKGIENGATFNPVIQDVVQISRYFKIATDTMLTVNLSRIGELNLRQLEAGNDIYKTGSNARILAISVNADNKENVEYVPIKAKAGYRSGFSDPEYIAKLPRYNLPNLPKSGTFRMFPTVGDSMLPIPEQSDVVTEYVMDWTTIKPATLCIVILKGEQDFVFKEVTVTAEGLHLHSLNKLYQDYVVAYSDVLEIWKYYSFHSRHLPEVSTELTQAVKEFKKEIKRLEDKITINQ